jgi:hypothetical protein
VPTPLRKRRFDGEPYTRPGEIEAMIEELSNLDRDALVERCAIPRRDDPTYVPSECLVYFVRSRRGEEPDTHYERLYRMLTERVLRRLPTPEDPGGQTESLTRASIREAAFDRFVALLAKDRTEYCEKLDYYEVRFDQTIANLRKDAIDKVMTAAKRLVSLESEVTGAPTAEVEDAALEQADGSDDPFELAAFDDARFRSRFDAAIDDLEPDQRRVVQMLRLGIPIDSKDPNVVTIAKTLGRTGRTIQTYRDKAFVALRAAFQNDVP